MHLQKMVSLCRGGVASPYENEEILYLTTVAGLIRKEPFFINLFLPSHQHSAFVNARLSSDLSRFQKHPTMNPLFDDLEKGIRQIALVPDETSATATAGQLTDDGQLEVDYVFKCICDDKEDRLGLLDAIIAYVDSPVS